MYWLGANWVDCLCICISSHYLLFVSIIWPSQFFYFLFELLRHLFYWFNKWHNHLTNVVFHFTKAVTKTELRKARIDLFIASILKLLYINILALFLFQYGIWPIRSPPGRVLHWEHTAHTVLWTGGCLTSLRPGISVPYHVIIKIPPRGLST